MLASHRRRSPRALVVLVALLVAPGCLSGGESDSSEEETAATDEAATDDGAATDDATDEATDDGTVATDEAPTDAEATATDAEPAGVETDSMAGAEPNTSDTSNRERLPETLREACMAMCDAQYAVDCTPAGSSIEICDLQCVAAVSTQRDFCIDEYTARVQCLGEGGYECVNDFPTPRATCAGETVAYSECVQDLPCKMYCAELVETGCADDEMACREECVADSMDENLSCDIRQDSYIACLGQLGLSCEDGNVIPHQNCISQLFDAADCRNDGDTCATWCEGAEALGCGSDACVADCEELAMDPTCGSDYERMLECGIRYGYVGCTDDGLVTDPDNILCDSESERYTECLEQPTP